MNRKKLKTIGNIALNVLLYVFLAVCVLAVVLAIIAKKEPDGAVDVFGYQLRIVTSDSMGASEYTDVSEYEIGSIPVRSLILIQTVPEEGTDDWYRDLEVGDVLTFRYVYTQQVTITHRIVSISERETGGFLIELAGDNKTSADEYPNGQVIDTSIPYNTNYVIGKVVGKTFILGLILSLLMQPLGIVLMIILPCLVIILLEVNKIVKVSAAEKRKREEEVIAKKEQEILELRQKVAALEQERVEEEEKAKEKEEDTSRSSQISN